MHANPRKIEQFNRLINVCTISYQNKKGFPQENNTVENFKKSGHSVHGVISLHRNRTVIGIRQVPRQCTNTKQHPIFPLFITDYKVYK